MVVKVVLNLLLSHYCLSHVSFRRAEPSFGQLLHNREGGLRLPDSKEKGCLVLQLKDKKHQASSGPQAPARLLWVLSWNGYMSQKVSLSPQDWAQPCLKEGFGSKRGSSALGPVCSPQITGREQHLSQTKCFVFQLFRAPLLTISGACDVL